MSGMGAETVARPVEERAGVHDRHFRTDHLMADLKGRSVRGGAVTLSAQAVKFVLQLGSTAVLARLLTPADFGLIAMVTAITGFAALFKDLGLSQATVQRAEITHKQVSTLFWINVLASAALGVVVAACAPLVAWFYAEPRLVWVTVALGGTFIFGGLTAQHTALLRRQMRFGPLAKIEIVSVAAGIGVALAMAMAGAEYWALVGMTAGQGLVMALGSWIASGWRPGWLSQRSGVRRMLGFGGGLTAFNVLNYFTRNADNVIVGVMLGSGPLGVYSRAYNLLMMPIRQFNAPISSVMVPVLSRLQDDPVRYRRAFLRAVSAIALAGMPLVSFLFVVADEVVAIVLGQGWEEAGQVFRWLAPAALLGTINVAPGWLCISLGRARVQVVWAAISAPIVVASFLMGASWGIVGVAGAFSLTWSVLLLVFIAMACRGSPVSLAQVAGAVLPHLSVSVLAAGVCMLLRNQLMAANAPPVLGVALSAAFFAATLVGTMLAIPSERRRLVSLLGEGPRAAFRLPGGSVA